MELRALRALGGVLATGLALIAVVAPSAGASSFSVTGNTDPSGPPTACTGTGGSLSCPSLRDAIAAVNNAGGTNTITLPAGTITLANGQLTIDNGDTVAIQGAGAGKTIIDTGGTSRIFRVSGTLTLDGVTLQNGVASGKGGTDGGAIEGNEFSTVTVQNSTLTSNKATSWGWGGAIYSGFLATLNVTDSTISGNSTETGAGGAIAADNLNMSGSTVDGNTTAGGPGGGIYLYNPFSECFIFCIAKPQASVKKSGLASGSTIVNSTIVGNSVGSGEGDGGGILIDGSQGFAPAHVAKATAASKARKASGPFGIPAFVSLVSDTIVGNSAANGTAGNIGAWGFAFATLQQSIVGGGVASGSPANCSLGEGDFDAGSNMFFDSSYSSTSNDNCFGGSNAPNDILSNDSRLANGSGLDTDQAGNFVLADNGGPTETVALLSGPAVNAVTPLPTQQQDAGVHGADAVTPVSCTDSLGLPLTTDQRGVARPDVAGTNCDIGAFESGAAALALTGTVAPNPGGIGQPITYTFTVNNNGPSFATHSTFDATLPAGATLGSVTPSQGSCTTTATTVTCALGVIPDGTATVAITITPGSSGTFAVTGTGSDRESGASAPLSLSATVNGAAATTTTSAPAPKVTTQAAGHICASRRAFSIHIQHARRLKIRSATVFVNGKAERTLKGKGLHAPVNLTSLPKGAFTIKIVAHQRNGHVIKGQRTYHTCATKLPGHKHLYL